jgi:NADPH:quinone reductase-like Zn-dependent oxidoreductase
VYVQFRRIAMSVDAPTREKTIKGFTRETYGPADALQLREIEGPVIEDDAVLVRVRAVAVNPFDWHMLTGVPYIVRIAVGLREPKTGSLGVDFAGTVEAVGKDVTEFEPGDEVYGGRRGAFAGYVSVAAAGAVAPKPANLTFEQAAAVPMAGITALQGLRDKGGIQPGNKVLINGASGGVGTFAIQIAKAFGAEVTGVCSPHNVDNAASLGADHVIDYTNEDFTATGRRYDLILDVAFNRSWAEYRRVLAAEGVLVGVGGPKTNRWVGSMGKRLRVGLAARFGSRKAPFFLADLNKEDLLVLKRLIEDGQVAPFVERQYELAELPDALDYVAQGHARGKIVVTM